MDTHEVCAPVDYTEGSRVFFRQCVSEDTYACAVNMNSNEGRGHLCVVARLFLSQSDWEKYCWIERYGLLAAFPG